MNEYDKFELAVKNESGHDSPLKASMRAARHVVGQARKETLNSMLNRLEKAVGIAPPSPKVLPQRKASQQASSAKLPSNHVQRHVCELYEQFVVNQEVKQARNAGRTASQRQDLAAPSVDSFLDVLKVYYPSYSKKTLEMMLRDAKDGIELVDRRHFIQRAKGSLADRLKLAFSNSDKDKNGSLSVDEFIKSVEATGAQPPGYSASRPCPGDELKAIIAKIFNDGDTNSDGKLDLDEFVELCGRETWLVSAFDRIVELGVRRKLKSEEQRLGMIFRVPISPVSRLVIGSPSSSRRRYRPGLFDLRRADDVGMMMSTSERKAL